MKLPFPFMVKYFCILIEMTPENLPYESFYKERTCIFTAKTAGPWYFFRILSQRNARIMNPKNPDSDMIWCIHSVCGFFKVPEVELISAEILDIWIMSVYFFIFMLFQSHDLYFAAILIHFFKN